MITELNQEKARREEQKLEEQLEDESDAGEESDGQGEEDDEDVSDHQGDDAGDNQGEESKSPLPSDFQKTKKKSKTTPPLPIKRKPSIGGKKGKPLQTLDPVKGRVGGKRMSKASLASSSGEDKEGAEILETVDKLQNLHDELRDCHQSLLYLEKCFQVLVVLTFNRSQFLYILNINRSVENDEFNFFFIYANLQKTKLNLLRNYCRVIIE